MGEIWKAAITDSFNRFVEKLITFLPNLLAMVTILIVGLVIAWIVKMVLSRFLRAIQFDKVSVRWGVAHMLSTAGMTFSLTHLVARFFYWLIVLITLILAMNALELEATHTLVAHFFSYLPHLFAALFILAIGYLVALFLSQAALIAAVNAQIDSARHLSRIVRWFIVILSLTMALYHLGVAEKIIVSAFSITFGGIVLALAIAFGWGGRDLAKEFLEKLRKTEGPREGSDSISHL
jgi:Mechanosensitive ion channel, conserved TM helix